MNEQRAFRGIWIPAEIWLDTDLTPLDKVILMEINSLDCDEKGCYASNDYLANFAGCSSSKVNQTVAKLKDKGYVTVENPQSPHRRIKTTYDSTYQNLSSNLSKNDKCTYQNLSTINIDDKDKDNNKEDVDILEIYHQECPKLPKVIKLTDIRKRAIRMVKKKYTIDEIRTVFRKANASTFLTGGGPRGWKADFDFLLRQDKFVKILEGGYDDFEQEEKNKSSFKAASFFEAAVNRK